MLDPAYARAHEDRADLLAGLARHDEALAAIDRALALAPTAYRHRRRGAILVELARYPEAIASLGAALALDPDDAVTLERRATAHLMLDEPTRALADLERALALKPNSRAVKRRSAPPWRGPTRGVRCGNATPPWQAAPTIRRR